MSMSYGADQLWLGDKTGRLHLVDASDGDFNLVEVCTLNTRGGPWGTRTRAGLHALHAEDTRGWILENRTGLRGLAKTAATREPVRVCTHPGWTIDHTCVFEAT